MSIPTPERPIEEQEYWFARLDLLDPGEYLSLYRVTTDPPEVFSQSTEAYIQGVGLRSRVIGTYLQAVPSRSLERAKSIYEAFAGSSRIADRAEIATGGLECLGWIARVDRAAGLDLWDRLVRDPVDDVRKRAMYLLIDDETGVVTATDDELAEAGITRTDAEQLAYAYLMAEQGQNLHDPLRHVGELAMRHLIAIDDHLNET